MALELLELLATVNILQPDRLVTRPTDELRWIRRVEPDATDVIAVALERLQALALFWVPQDDLVVIPDARENLAVGRNGDRPDPIAAIFSNVREHICNGRLRLSPLDLRHRGKIATFRKLEKLPVAF